MGFGIQEKPHTQAIVGSKRSLRLLPYDPKNLEELETFARLMASRMAPENSKNHYSAVFGRNFSYAVGGSTMDYAYESVGIPLSFTIELRPAGNIYSG